MSVEKIRDALGTLLTDPEDAQAWTVVEEGVRAGTSAELERLMEKARVRYEGYRLWPAVARVLELELEIEDDVRFTGPKAAELGRIYREELLQTEQALAAYQKAVELRPNDQASEDAVGEIEAARARWSETVETSLTEALDGDDPATQARFLVNAAEATYRYAQHDEATLSKVLEYLKQAKELNDSNWRALLIGQLIHTELGNWEELADVLTEKVGNAPSKEDRVAAAHRLAQVALHQLDDKDRAVEAYQLLLDLSPGNREALNCSTSWSTTTPRPRSGTTSLRSTRTS
jgi:tetratricopeptide (TPR) repeat protein